MNSHAMGSMNSTLSISDLINTFIAHFHYLNSKGKRSGFLFFANDALTKQLELRASRLIAALNTLAAKTNLTEDKKATQFLVALENALIWLKGAKTLCTHSNSLQIHTTRRTILPQR